MKQWILAKFLCDRVQGVERFATHPRHFPSQVPPLGLGITQFPKIRLKSLLVLRTRENHPTLRKSANGIAASSPLRQNQSFEVKFLVPSQKLKWMLKYCSHLKYFLINQLQRYPSRVVYMFRQISYLGPELRAFSGQENLTFLRKFI